MLSTNCLICLALQLNIYAQRHMSLQIIPQTIKVETGTLATLPACINNRGLRVEADATYILTAFRF